VRERSQGYLHLDRAKPLKVEAITGVLLGEDGFHDASGHHGLAGFECRAASGQMGGEPGHRIEGMSQNVPSVSFTDQIPVLGGAPEQGRKIGPG